MMTMLIMNNDLDGMMIVEKAGCEMHLFKWQEFESRCQRTCFALEVHNNNMISFRAFTSSAR